MLEEPFFNVLKPFLYMVELFLLYISMICFGISPVENVCSAPVPIVLETNAWGFNISVGGFQKLSIWDTTLAQT